MNKIKILMVIPYLPNQKNVITILAQNILNSLKEKCNPTLIWILQTPSQKFENIYDDIQIKPIQNYHNACNIMDKEKPDVVISELSFDYSAYPFILAAKFKKIPIISYYLYGYNFNITSFPDSSLNVFLRKLRQFFSKYTIETNNKSYSRGKFYLYKYFFYLKTLKSSNLNVFEFFSHVIESLWINSFGTLNKNRDSRLITDKVCLPTNDWIDPLIKLGFQTNSLIVTGSPIFDNYNISDIKQKRIDKNKIIKILLVTASHQRHGQISEHVYSEKLFNVISAIHNNPKFFLALKIHPTSENIKNYYEILGKLSTDIPIYQQESLSALLDDYDIAISFGKWTGAHIDILNSGTPLIMMTLFDNPELIAVLKFDCAFRCDSVSDLESVINDIILSPKPVENTYSLFNQISNPLDGKASERFADVVLSVLKND